MQLERSKFSDNPIENFLVEPRKFFSRSKSEKNSIL